MDAAKLSITWNVEPVLGTPGMSCVSNRRSRFRGVLGILRVCVPIRHHLRTFKVLGMPWNPRSSTRHSHIWAILGTPSKHVFALICMCGVYLLHALPLPQCALNVPTFLSTSHSNKLFKGMQVIVFFGWISVSLCLQNCVRVLEKLFRVDAKLLQNCVRMLEKLLQNCVRVLEKLLRFDAKLFQNCVRMLKKLLQNCVRVDAKLFQNCSKTGHAC